jgi:hypothetical protein
MKFLKQYGGWIFLASCLAVSCCAHGMAKVVSETLPLFPLLGTVFYESPNTGTSLETMDPDGVRKLWQAGVDVFEQSTDFFDQFEGGANAVVETITDTSKGKGQKIDFSVMSGFYDEPHMGEELFETSDDFEEILMDTNELAVDWLRHATRVTERMEEVMGMRGEIVSGVNEEIGKWLGRLKTEQMLMMFRERIPADNVVYANGKAQDTLVSADTIAWDPIVALKTQMQRLGGMSAEVGRNANGVPVFRNLVIAPNDVLYSLELDPEFRDILKSTRDEASSKTLFDGGYVDVRGQRIMEYNPIDHDGEGAIGSPLNPKALLGNAITAGTAVFDITGGGNPTSAAKTKKKYFKYFDGYAYRFLAGDVLSPASATHYALIVNPPNAVTDPNKIGMYSYTTGNNGNKITIVNRLGSAASTARVTTLGGVTWNTGVWSGIHTDVHPQGALVLPCNAKGQIDGDILMLGRRAARRGYGKYRNKRTQQEHEGGFITDRFVTTVFGQALRKDRLSRVPAATRMRVAMQYAGVPTPVIT